MLTPMDLIDRIAALVPPPRTHRHRSFGVLVPNSPLRAAVTALAQPAPAQTATEKTGTNDSAPGMAQEGKSVGGGAQSPLTQQAEPKSAPAKRSPAHYLWAVLIARIYRLRGVPPGVPYLWWANAPNRLYHRWCRGEADFGAYLRGRPGPAHISGARATAVG
ncbi:MAG: hypothetical protein ACJA2P_002696 [Rhodoferax sp.]